MTDVTENRQTECMTKRIPPRANEPKEQGLLKTTKNRELWRIMTIDKVPRKKMDEIDDYDNDNKNIDNNITVVTIMAILIMIMKIVLVVIINNNNNTNCSHNNNTKKRKYDTCCLKSSVMFNI